MADKSHEMSDRAALMDFVYRFGAAVMNRTKKIVLEEDAKSATTREISATRTLLKHILKRDPTDREIEAMRPG